MKALAICSTSFGMNLPTDAHSARNTADACMDRQMRLATESGHDTNVGVVADLPQGSGAPCPHRYPSPDGRRVAALRASLFFCFVSTAYPFGRQFAHTHSGASRAFDLPHVLTFDIRANRVDQQRGGRACSKHSRDNLRQYSFFWEYRPSRPVATRSSSRQRSAALAALEHRPSLAAILPRAPLSALPVTSPTARPSRTAATDITAHRAIFTGPSVPPGTGGLFRFKTAPEGARPCSRRS
ncbi:hypothetical protein SAMN05216208_2503 [Roseovarius nanhaiticus]|nr:hypothetical protein SAMN05216208_2503 [Roseovarius nanhaiticus]